MYKVALKTTIPLVCIISLIILASGCGGSTATKNDPVTPPPPPVKKVAVTISPSAATLTTSQSQNFKATVTNATNTSVTWLVDGIIGGSGSIGTISAAGVYTAPSASGNHTVSVKSVADASKSASAAVAVTDPAPPPPVSAVLTERYDSARTGQMLSEKILTPANVNSTTFGRLITYVVDGLIYTQPLYVPNLSIPGQGTHNVVFVATEHDSVYAFDADAKQSAALWRRSFIDPANGITTVSQSDVGSTIYPEIGITGTPVIDQSTQTMYLVAFTKENGNYFHRLHALDLATGSEKFGGPVAIQASVRGTGDGNDGNGNVPFQPQVQLQRPGLLLLNGVVYVAFGSHGDNGSYHGWIMAYNTSTLDMIAVWNSTPNGKAGAIWASGCGLSADSQGNIYAVTANGDFDKAFGGQNASDSVLRLTLNGSALTAADYFAPYNQQTLAADDADLGSSGLTLIPGFRLGVAAGKEGSIYLVNLDNLGHFNMSDNSQIHQFLPNAIGNAAEDNNFSTATYFNGNIYYIGENDTIRQFAITNGVLSARPIEQSATTFGQLGAQAEISASGTNNAILWAIEYVRGGGNGILHAYDANDVSTELYNSTQVGGRDSLGPAVKFSTPTVINGKVYVGSQYRLSIFGNL